MCLIIYGCIVLKDHLVYFAGAKNTRVAPRICEIIHYSTATYCSVRSPFVMQIGARHEHFILLCLYCDNRSAKYYTMLAGLCWRFGFFRHCMFVQTCVCVWRPSDSQRCICDVTSRSAVKIRDWVSASACKLYSKLLKYFCQFSIVQ